MGLYSCRGQSSKTFVYEAAQQYAHQGKGVTVIFCGDWDPTGRCVPRSVVERMERYGSGELDLEFRQIAITAVEVEALRPGLLRQRLNETIEGLVDDVRQWNIEARTEEAERELLRSLQGTVKKIVRRVTGESAAEDDEE